MIDTDPRRHDRITYDPDGVLDEVVLTDVEHVHIERMDNTAWWIGITTAEGHNLMVNLGAKNQRAAPYGHAAWDEFSTPEGRPAIPEEHR